MLSDVMTETSFGPVSETKEEGKRPAKKDEASGIANMLVSKKNLCALGAVLLALLIISFAANVKTPSKAQAKVYTETK